MCLKRINIVFKARLSLGSPKLAYNSLNRLAWLRLPRAGIQGCATLCLGVLTQHFWHQCFSDASGVQWRPTLIFQMYTLRFFNYPKIHLTCLKRKIKHIIKRITYTKETRVKAASRSSTFSYWNQTAHVPPTTVQVKVNCLRHTHPSLLGAFPNVVLLMEQQPERGDSLLKDKELTALNYHTTCLVTFILVPEFCLFPQTSTKYPT
jgi:hypothetical protein